MRHHDELFAFLRARYAEREAMGATGLELADLAAKRVILDGIADRLITHETAAMLADADGDQGREGAWRLVNAETDEMADEVLCALAKPFAGHPDYREEWRP